MESSSRLGINGTLVSGQLNLDQGNHVAQQCFTSGYPLWTLEDPDPNAKNVRVAGGVAGVSVQAFHPSQVVRFRN